MPLQRFGLHFGGTWRIKKAEVSFAYVHFWNTAETVTNGKVTELVVDPTTGEQLTEEEGATIVNNGRFTQKANLGSVSFRYFFK